MPSLDRKRKVSWLSNEDDGHRDLNSAPLKLPWKSTVLPTSRSKPTSASGGSKASSSEKTDSVVSPAIHHFSTTKEATSQKGLLKEEKLSVNFVPGQWDVICIPDSSSENGEDYKAALRFWDENHVGNRRMKVLVAMNLQRYVMKCNSYLERHAVIKEITSQVMNAGGKFVICKAEENDQWYQIESKQARAKVKQIMEDAVGTQIPNESSSSGTERSEAAKEVQANLLESTLGLALKRRASHKERRRGFVVKEKNMVSKETQKEAPKTTPKKVQEDVSKETQKADAMTTPNSTRDSSVYGTTEDCKEPIRRVSETSDAPIRRSSCDSISSADGELNIIQVAKKVELETNEEERKGQRGASKRKQIEQDPMDAALALVGLGF